MSKNAADQNRIRCVTYMPIKTHGVNVEEIAKLLTIAVSNVMNIVIDKSRRLLVSLSIDNESWTVASQEGRSNKSRLCEKMTMSSI